MRSSAGCKLTRGQPRRVPSHAPLPRRLVAVPTDDLQPAQAEEHRGDLCAADGGHRRVPALSHAHLRVDGRLALSCAGHRRALLHRRRESVAVALRRTAAPADRRHRRAGGGWGSRAREEQG
eukprot:3819236-Rhodomonas_salina.11